MVNSNWDLGFSRRVFLSEEYLGACGHSYIQPYGRSWQVTLYVLDKVTIVAPLKSNDIQIHADAAIFI